MSLSASTLKSQLAAALSAFPATEADAIEAWAEAFKQYFSGAAAGAIPVVPASLAAASAALTASFAASDAAINALSDAS